MRQILSSGQVPTCVICENDDMAIGALNACSDLGYRVPEDISLIGFDDMSYSKYLTPSLTTVRKLTAVLVKKGIERLTQLIQGETFATPVQEVINPEIIVRASVKRLARGESVN
jgi:DNA-binding LacI/PurR family transcriptional regulator